MKRVNMYVSSSAQFSPVGVDWTGLWTNKFIAGLEVTTGPRWLVRTDHLMQREKAHPLKQHFPINMDYNAGSQRAGEVLGKVGKVNTCVYKEEEDAKMRRKNSPEKERG